MPRDTKLRQMNFPRRYKAHTVIQQSKNGARKKFGFFKSVSLFHFPGSSERLTRIHHTRSVPFVFLSSFLSFFFLSRIELSKKCHQIQSVTPLFHIRTTHRQKHYDNFNEMVNYVPRKTTKYGPA